MTGAAFFFLDEEARITGFVSSSDESCAGAVALALFGLLLDAVEAVEARVRLGGMIVLNKR